MANANFSMPDVFAWLHPCYIWQLPGEVSNEDTDHSGKVQMQIGVQGNI